MARLGFALVVAAVLALMPGLAAARCEGVAPGVEPRFRFVQAGENLDADLLNNVWKGSATSPGPCTTRLRPVSPTDGLRRSTRDTGSHSQNPGDDNHDQRQIA